MDRKRTSIIFIYGPPAVGKTTIARALSNMTGYRILHPHLFTPIASALMTGDTRTNRTFRILITKLRMESLRAGIRAEVPGIILTGVHVRKAKHNHFIEKLRRLPTSVRFVRLTASEHSLMRRVTHKSRHVFDHHKITTREQLRECMAGGDVVSAIPGVRSVTVDTDLLKPQQAARKIARALRIAKSR